MPPLPASLRLLRRLGRGIRAERPVPRPVATRASCTRLLAALAGPALPFAALGQARAAAEGLAAGAGGAIAERGGRATAQDAAADRIWGRVHAAGGDRYEGFITWKGRGSRDAAAWADVLEMDRRLPRAFHDAWLSATGGVRPVRTIELEGYRISWDEEDAAFPSDVPAAVRFGRLAELEVSGGQVLARVRSAGADSAATIIRFAAPSQRRSALVVFDREAGEHEVLWRDLRRVEFSAPPPGAEPPSRRLHGTVEDGAGRAFTGYVAWDSDEILGSETLDGRDEDGEDRDVRFADIQGIERGSGATRVVLASGRELMMSGTNDVGRGNRGARVFDPGFGMVEVEWDEFASLRLEPPTASEAAYGEFRESWRLAGEVATLEGDVLAGLLRWDAEHEWSWELLRGASRGVEFLIEFGAVARVEKAGAGAVVTLIDGRAFELDGSGDVGQENRGIFVLPDGVQDADAPGWRYVSWEEFREARFALPVADGDLGEGRRQDRGLGPGTRTAAERAHRAGGAP